MPDLSRFIIKLSLVYLACALAMGVLLTAPVQERLPALAAAAPAYVHLFVVGWLTQLIFGVAYWLFPRYSRERPYGRRGLALTGFVLLNVGLLLRLASEPALVWTTGAVWQWGLAVSALLQWIGGLALVAYLWSRVRTK